MKIRVLLVILFGLVLLAGCAQAEEPVGSPTTESEIGQLLATGEPTVNSPTNTPHASPTETSVSETETEPTPIPCQNLLTSANQEGPFYSPGSPGKSSLIEDGMPGTPILIIGRVFDQNCKPIPGAKLDFWLADVNGEYDNAGYTLRGHLFTDGNGNYTLESIEPTPYTGRPPHIHVKVFAPDGHELLTTQMYFAGSEASPDVIASPDLLVQYLETDDSGRQQILFNFVVQN